MPSDLRVSKISKDRVQLITVPGQNGVEKEDVVLATKLLLQTVISTQYLLMRMKGCEFNLGTAFAHLRNAEVLADENQAGPVGIANPQRS